MVVRPFGAEGVGCGSGSVRSSALSKQNCAEREEKNIHNYKTKSKFEDKAGASGM